MQCWTHFSRQYNVIKVFCIHIDYPKFDPYPFIPQKSWSFSFSLAFKTSPVAVTISAKDQHQRWFYEEVKVTLFLKFNCLYQAVIKDYCLIRYFLSYAVKQKVIVIMVIPLSTNYYFLYIEVINYGCIEIWGEANKDGNVSSNNNYQLITYWTTQPSIKFLIKICGSTPFTRLLHISTKGTF